MHKNFKKVVDKMEKLLYSKVTKTISDKLRGLKSISNGVKGGVLNGLA